MKLSQSSMVISSVCTWVLSKSLSSYPMERVNTVIPRGSANNATPQINSASTRKTAQIRSILLFVDMRLSHIIAVVAHQNRADDTFHIGKGIDKVGVVILQPDLQIQLHHALLRGFALD